MLPSLAAGLLAAASPKIVIDGPTATALLTRPHASVLDTRSLTSWLSGHIPAAVRVDWRIGTVGGLLSGKLGPPETVATALARAGVWNDGPVLVVGAWEKGWGEEGRVAWDLIYLGHQDVHVLRGGMQTWKGDTRKMPDAPPAGDFTARPQPSLRVDGRSLHDDLASWRIVDAREPNEYAGATPYGESRGGHIPDAVNVPWKTLLSADPTTLSAVGSDFGPDRPVVTYCTGGVRSAMAWVLLRDAGYADVRNYDGSWWEWSSQYGPE